MGILFEWFYNNLLKNNFLKKYFSSEKLGIYSLNLSIYLCYYIRIYDKIIRNDFCKLMKQSFGQNFEFEDFPRKIQNIIADSVELEKGIAKNRALLENLFAIFVCLNTKIPLFIIGKPGSSKSLCSLLIFKSMNGKDSSSEFFREFPKVYIKSYQGSLTSESRGVLKIFQKARKSLEDKSLENKIISSIYFDEIGLAEISKNNPLKVIHSQLEYDENEKKVSFIGISNWPLDSSKMNRGIHLSITEPDKEDLKFTALKIAESYDKRLAQDYKEYFEFLALSYYDYKEELKNNPFEFGNEDNKIVREFHGNRDFYHLIKIASKLLIKNELNKDNYEIENIINDSIERNFGGLDKSIKIFKGFFKKYVPNINEINEYNVMDCIKDNIKDPTSRYLLIITESSISHFLIKLILEELRKDHVFYYGSDFEEDNIKGYYSAKVLNKIQITMSKDNVMILKNLTSMYPSLYDLFNQNFKKIGKSNYARIALGESNTQNYYVNDSFRCIVILDKDKINKQDPPFINRFEKHIITFEYLLNDNQIKMSKQIEKLFNNLFEEGNQELKIDLKSQLINCGIEEICGIFYQISEIFNKERNNNSEEEIKLNDINLEVSENNIPSISKKNVNISQFVTSNLNIYKEKIFKKIIPTFSQDLIFYSKYSNFAQKYKEEFQNIIDIYFENQNNKKNLKSYLKNIDFNKHMIYTFSNILDSIFGLNNSVKLIENKMFHDFTQEKTKNIFVEQINSEREVDEKILDFYTNNEFNLCAFHFDIEDCKHLNHINYLIEANENNLKDFINLKSKVILFIIHLNRLNKNENKEKKENFRIPREYLISHLTNYKQIFIDNLNGKEINIKEVFDSSNIELFNNIDLINKEEEFTKDLYHAFTLISYNIKINFTDIDNDEYIEKVCNFINNNNELKEKIKKLIKNKINKIKDNIIINVFNDYNFEEDDVDFLSILIKYMKSIFNTNLIDIVILLEKNNIFSTKLLNSEEMKIDFFERIFEEYINKLDFSIKNYASFSQMVKIDYLFGLSYPFILQIFKEINCYMYSSLIDIYLENDDKYRTEQFEENIIYYFKEKENLENNLKKEFEKKYFSKIINENELNLDNRKLENYGKILFKDYIIYFLSKSNNKYSDKIIFDFFLALFDLFLSRDEENNKKNEENEIERNDMKFSIENISKFVLFIESYKQYIYTICEFICSINLKINNFIKDLLSKLSLKQFKIKNKNISYVNDIFFNIFESILYCIININIKFEEFSDDDFDKFLNEIKIFSNVLMKVNIELRLTLKQLLYLLDFIQVREIFGKYGIPLKHNLQSYLNILQKESEQILIPDYLNKEIENKNIDIINEEFSFLTQKLSHLKDYPQLIGKLLNNKIKISKDEKYRMRLIKISLSNNLFITKVKNIFEILLKKYTICPLNKNKTNIAQNKKSNEENNGEEEEDEEEEEENEFDKDGTGEIFLSHLEEDKNNLIIKYLNEINNLCIDEILLSLFDGKFTLYFENKKPEDLILNQSFDIFKKCVKYIENKKYDNFKINKLGFLYCISYIKYYCYNFAKIIYSEEYQNLNKNEILSFLRDSNFKKVIKIYILKILNLIILKNYSKFLNLVEEKQLFHNDFDFNEKFKCSLNYLFLQNDNFVTYKKIREEYSLCKMQKFKSKINKDFIELIGKELMIFYDLLINEEISNLNSNYNQDFYNKFSHFILDILNKIKVSQITIEILSLFYNFNVFRIKLLPLIRKLPILDYEILLYSHKLALISSMSDKKSLYSKLISPQIINNINNSYIPGGEPNDSLKIESGEQIKKYFEEGKGEAVYMCSCNYFYTVSGCGKPMVTFQCKNCGELIGGTNHIMVKREGHVRIIKDNENKDGNNCKYLSQLMDEVEKEKQIQFKGFHPVKYEFFIKKNKNVRKMNDITYRILSFIFFSCIYWSEKLEFFNENNIQSFFINGNKQNNDILFILKIIWEILIEELIKREINNIQCFLNMIFPELSKIILENQKAMNKHKEREEFELLCNQVIENAILNYNNYYIIYNKNNKEILEIKDHTIKSILQETEDINNLPYKDFPLINYFYASTYPNYDQFLEQFSNIPNNLNQYPVITNYLNSCENESIQFLENFKLINPFINYTLEKYSNKISREEAKKIIIKNELNNDNEMKKLFNDFKRGWKNIYKKLSNYDCQGKLPEKMITENDCLAYCLNDNIEDDYGKYIATAYKDFITYQNNFLKNLIENNSNIEYLYPYSKALKKEIIVQKATQKEVISLDIKNDNYNSFEDIIYSFAYRNCFKENGDINYLNYKENKYDFKSIEIELSKILLPEKRLFSNEHNQDFIVYAFEAFNHNECIISNFKDKINEIKLLSNEEKITLSNITEKIDYKLILFNLQSLFLYFTKKRNISGDEILFEEIKKLPEKIIKLDEEFINIFKNTQLNIKLNQLVDCYEYVELLNYDKILLNVSKKIDENLDINQIDKLNAHFESKDNYLISKKDLGNAVRKFICRFLVGDIFHNVNRNLLPLLKEKNHLWNEKINLEENEEQFNKEINKLESINILVTQSIDFYEKLGGERAEEKINNIKKSTQKKEKKKKKKGKRDLDY